MSVLSFSRLAKFIISSSAASKLSLICTSTAALCRISAYSCTWPSASVITSPLRSSA
jgi:hypothetical protein